MKKIRFLSTLFIVIINLISTVLGMDHAPIKLTEIAYEQRTANNNYQLPEGVSDNYLAVIHIALNNVGAPGTKPERDMSDFENLKHADLLNELVLGCAPLSHLISQYITDEIARENCIQAIKSDNLDTFKRSFEIMKILHAKFSDNEEIEDWINQKDEKEIENLDAILKINPKFFNNNSLSKYAGNTLLHEAVRFNRPDIAQILIGHGANINIQNNHKETPLFHATKNDALNSVQMLLSLKANRKIQANSFLYEELYDRRTHQNIPYLRLYPGFRADQLDMTCYMQRLFDQAELGEPIVIPKEREFNSCLFGTSICCPCCFVACTIGIISMCLTCGYVKRIKKSKGARRIIELDERAWEIGHESGCCCMSPCFED